MPSPKPDATEREEWPPVAWFMQLCLSVDRGDFDRAAECQRRLEEQGWIVRRKRRPKATRKAEGGGR